MPGQVEEESGQEQTSHHIEVVQEESHSERGDGQQPSPGLRDSKGWDGKLRINRNALIENPEALSDPDYSDEDHVVPGEEISADEGKYRCLLHHTFSSMSMLSRRNGTLFGVDSYVQIFSMTKTLTQTTLV